LSDKPLVEEKPPLNAEKRTKKQQPEHTNTPQETEVEDETIDDCAYEAPSQWSAESLTSALHAQSTDLTLPNIES
jgi:hypothetical protein